MVIHLTRVALIVPKVSVEEGEDRAKAEGIMFIETSAKGGYNIKVRTKPSNVGRTRPAFHGLAGCFFFVFFL